MNPFEMIPANEDVQIANIVQLTMQQLRNRYPGERPALRGVHPKDHGCVNAVFEVSECLPKELQVGLFNQCGKKYEAVIRFSNAATLVLPDSTSDTKTGEAIHGSRGMAIKVMGVAGQMAESAFGAATQDFLMVNHPVFAFANVEDYEVLSTVLADPNNKEDAKPFFGIQIPKGGEAAKRAKATLDIITRIRSAAEPDAYQTPPSTPVDNNYFSGAPFLFGPDCAMKFRVETSEVPLAPPNTFDPNYLRNGLVRRLTPGSNPVVFKFQVQRRTLEELMNAEGKLETQIENACTKWSETELEFITVATVTIPAQDFDTPERRAACENLFFTPWHSLEAHRPIGGINRLRKAVYLASAGFRHMTKEPSTRTWK